MVRDDAATVGGQGAGSGPTPASRSPVPAQL